ncbi:MAG: hypothetical protein WDN25_17600 [Acetobacteraceae bacterium]
MPFNGRGLTQTADNCFIHLGDAGGKRSAMRVVGRIFRQSTGGRDSPPACLNEFDTAGTPFALGHVMALELGGCDTSENIVPQYGQWQGSEIGAWRLMEKAVYNMSTDADVLIVDVAYGPGPFAKSWQQQYDDFAGGDKLFSWEEARIPVHFRVWAVAATWTGAGGVSIAGYLGGDAGAKDAAIAGLVAALPDTRKVFDQRVSEMPAVDRDYWRIQMMRGYTRLQHRTYERVIEKENEHRKSVREKLMTNADGSRKSGRLAVKDPANRTFKEAVPLSLGRWLNDPDQMRKLVAKLQDPLNPPRAVLGWNGVEVAQITPAYVSGAVYGV